MKKVFAILIMLFPIVGFSQEKDELTMLKDYLKKEKREVVKEYMALSEVEAGKFWPVYDEYSVERTALSKERNSLLSDYAKSFQNLNDEQADEMVKRNLKNDKTNLSLQKKYYKKMKKAVGSLKAAQFLQLENYLQTITRAEIQEMIPFIGEIERKSGH